MKNLFLVLTAHVLFSYCLPGITLSPASAQARYYFSATGSDALKTSSVAKPFKSISKLNLIFLHPGDSIFFKSGDAFTGTIHINQSGTAAKPIVITSYGTGAKPVISAFKKLTVWKNKGKGVYETDITGNVNIVTIDNKLYEPCRYPNEGYMSLETHKANSSITDVQLAGNWAGAEVVIRNRRYLITKNTVTKQAGGILYYNGSGNKEPMDGYGYFLQKDIRFLDKFGEWYCNKGKLSIFFGSNNPSIYQVQANYLDTGISIRNVDNVIVDGLSLQGAGVRGIDVYYADNVEVKNCDINLCNESVFGAYTNEFLITMNLITNSVASGINLTNGCINSLIKRNVIEKTGLFPGMGKNVYNGINLTAEYDSPSGSIVEYNKIDSTGFSGIRFTGDGIIIRNNYIDHFALTKDDCGGISTGETDSVNINKKSVIESNVILNGIGEPEGTVHTQGLTYGILLDDNTSNVDVLNNTAAFCSNGIYLHNNGSIRVSGNTFFNNYTQLSMAHDVHRFLRNNTITNNIFANNKSGQYTANFLSSADDIKYFGKVDSNYYVGEDNIRGVTLAQTPEQVIAYRILKDWRTYSGFDSHSKSVITANLRFECNPNGIPVTVTLDKTYTDVRGKAYSGTITLKRYSSLVLKEEDLARPEYITYHVGKLYRNAYSSRVNN